MLMRYTASNSYTRRGWRSLFVATSSYMPTPEVPSHFFEQNRSVSSFLSLDWDQQKNSGGQNNGCYQHQRMLSANVHNVADSENNSEGSQHVFLKKLDGDNDGVAKLIFNRPSAANAMGRKMLGELQSAIAHLTDHETNVRCVVLTSATDKVFSAGADLRERSTMTQKEAAAFVTSLRGTFDALANLPMPVISAIEGVAVGGGLEIALTSDIIVAGDNAKFGLPETSLAIIPGAGGTQRLPRLIGVARSKELIFSARRIDAKTAQEYGLVQHVVPAGEAQEKALEIAKEIASNGPLAIRAAKSAIMQGMEASSLTEAMEIERTYYKTIIPTEDRLEGLAAFREKRKPEYKGV